MFQGKPKKVKEMLRKYAACPRFPLSPFPFPLSPSPITEPPDTAYKDQKTLVCGRKF